MFLFFFFSSTPFPYLYLPFSFFFCSLALGLSSLHFAHSFLLFVYSTGALHFSSSSSFFSSTPLVLSSLFFFFSSLRLLHWCFLHFSFFFFLFSFLLFVYSRVEDLSFFFSLTQKNSLSYTHRSPAEKWRSAFYTNRPTCFFFFLFWFD